MVILVYLYHSIINSIGITITITVTYYIIADYTHITND